MPKVLRPFLGQDEISSVAPKGLTHLMRDPWGVSVLWPLKLIPSCLLNKSIVFSSADFFNHSDRAIKADIMSWKHCQLRVQVCAQMSPTAVTTSKHRWEKSVFAPQPFGWLGQHCWTAFPFGRPKFCLIRCMYARTFWDFLEFYLYCCRSCFLSLLWLVSLYIFALNTLQMF